MSVMDLCFYKSASVGTPISTIRILRETKGIFCTRCHTRKSKEKDASVVLPRSAPHMYFVTEVTRPQMKPVTVKVELMTYSRQHNRLRGTYINSPLAKRKWKYPGSSWEVSRIEKKITLHMKDLVSHSY